MAIAFIRLSVLTGGYSQDSDPGLGSAHPKHHTASPVPDTAAGAQDLEAAAAQGGDAAPEQGSVPGSQAAVSPGAPAVALLLRLSVPHMRRGQYSIKAVSTMLHAANACDVAPDPPEWVEAMLGSLAACLPHAQPLPSVGTSSPSISHRSPTPSTPNGREAVQEGGVAPGLVCTLMQAMSHPTALSRLPTGARLLQSVDLGRCCSHLAPEMSARQLAVTLSCLTTLYRLPLPPPAPSSTSVAGSDGAIRASAATGGAAVTSSEVVMGRLLPLVPELGPSSAVQALAALGRMAQREEGVMEVDPISGLSQWMGDARGGHSSRPVVPPLVADLARALLAHLASHFLPGQPGRGSSGQQREPPSTLQSTLKPRRRLLPAPKEELRPSQLASCVWACAHLRVRPLPRLLQCLMMAPVEVSEDTGRRKQEFEEGGANLKGEAGQVSVTQLGWQVESLTRPELSKQPSEFLPAPRNKKPKP